MFAPSQVALIFNAVNTTRLSREGKTAKGRESKFTPLTIPRRRCVFVYINACLAAAAAVREFKPPANTLPWFVVEVEFEDTSTQEISTSYS